MTVVNIRGTSGSGKSTLVKRLLKEFPNEPVFGQFAGMRKPRIVGYLIKGFEADEPDIFIVGSYNSQCGGCDSMSYKGAHDDMEAMIREHASLGHNVVFEGLTVSSTLTRWLGVSNDYPDFWWAFMSTPEEECHQRILARNGGKEPKRKGAQQLADYQIKYRGCMRHIESLKNQGEQVILLSSDDKGYNLLLAMLGYETE